MSLRLVIEISTTASLTSLNHLNLEPSVTGKKASSDRSIRANLQYLHHVDARFTRRHSILCCTADGGEARSGKAYVRVRIVMTARMPLLIASFVTKSARRLTY